MCLIIVVLCSVVLVAKSETMSSIAELEQKKVHTSLAGQFSTISVLRKESCRMHNVLQR